MKSDKKALRRRLIMDAFSGVCRDCFGYDKETHNCRILTQMVCRTGVCPFYKTIKERCDECKATRKTITCEYCKAHGLK